MDNKEGKTFAELFSSSLEESKTIEQNSSNVIKANNSAEEIKKDSSIAFDSLFDNQGKQESINILNEFSIQEPSSLENKDSELEHSKPLNFNSIFAEEKDQRINNINLQSNSISNNISNAVNEKKESVQESIIFNPFFEDAGEDESSTSYDLIQSKVDSNNKEPESTKNELSSNNNLFFASDRNTTLSTVKANEKPIDSSFVDNPFLNIVDNPKNAEEEILANDILTTNPFFTEKNLVIETKKIDENPFFQDTVPNNIVNDENKTVTNESITSLTEKNNKEQSNSKTVSPFFEIENKSEENPFFQNQLNLIENHIATSSVNSSIDTSKSKHYSVKIVKKKEPLIKVILGVLSYALFIWLLLIGAALLFYVLDIKIRAAKNDYSSPTFNAYVVLTGSMLPEIQVKDVVVTKKIDAADLQEGDVITFASADQRFFGTIITHRIIKKNPPSGTDGYTFQTKGDYNNVADSALVPENAIYGKVILKIPKLGYLQEFLTLKGGWIVVILIPCLAVISYDTVKLIKGLKRKNYKNIKVQK